jgi:aspartate racemase
MRWASRSTLHRPLQHAPAPDERAGGVHGERTLLGGLTARSIRSVYRWVAHPVPMKTMQTIGLLGGMSFESTIPYYRAINETIREALGGLHSAKLVLLSVDFHEIERLQHAGDWTQAGARLADGARLLERAGAHFVVLCTNTMHKVAGAIEHAVSIPLLHIADPTAAAIAEAGLTTVGFLGTRFTMEEDFYRARLRAHGIDAIVPGDEDRAAVHRVIYEELCRGVVRDASRERYREIIGRLVRGGAQGIVLGCTEIAMLVGADDAPVPIFDTCLIHARAAALRALSLAPATVGRQVAAGGR